MSRSRLLTLRYVTGAALLIGAAGIALAERRRPLRRQGHDANARNTRNALMGASCAVVIAALETPATQMIARANEEHGRGLAGLLPGWLRPMAAFAVMDYGFYVWHVATHKVPFLWRFHRVHHVDPDMDMSTAVRFHLVDMAISLPWRLVQVRASGATSQVLALWRRFFTLSILFHHSNWALPGRWDAWLSTLLTTPEMHGIHHSAKQAERDSNWSSGISLWDRLHGTFRATPPQDELTIGVDDPHAADDVPLEPALRAPFIRSHVREV